MVESLSKAIGLAKVGLHLRYKKTTLTSLAAEDGVCPASVRFCNDQ